MSGRTYLPHISDKGILSRVLKKLITSQKRTLKWQKRKENMDNVNAYCTFVGENSLINKYSFYGYIKKHKLRFWTR